MTSSYAEVHVVIREKAVSKLLVEVVGRVGVGLQGEKPGGKANGRREREKGEGEGARKGGEKVGAGEDRVCWKLRRELEKGKVVGGSLK
jgi:hypothetical protein